MQSGRKSEPKVESRVKTSGHSAQAVKSPNLTSKVRSTHKQSKAKGPHRSKRPMRTTSQKPEPPETSTQAGATRRNAAASPRQRRTRTGRERLPGRASRIAARARLASTRAPAAGPAAQTRLGRGGPHPTGVGFSEAGARAVHCASGAATRRPSRSGDRRRRACGVRRGVDRARAGPTPY